MKILNFQMDNQKGQKISGILCTSSGNTFFLFQKVKNVKKFHTINFSHWAIPENIHTIPLMAFRISEGEGGGFTIMEF